MSNVTIIGVRDIPQCRDLSQNILRSGQPIAMDAEGLSLGATGRLTLLQIRTADGKEFIIDVVNQSDVEDTESGKELLEKGLIKEVLESDVVLKIVHGCFSDSAALFHQFNIQLKNVFDTQCAHITLEEDNGVKFPRKLPLEDIIEKYGTTRHTAKDFKDVWLSVKDYWLIRPLTDEAIEYASQDVGVLHELYGTMKGLVDQVKNGQDIFLRYLDWELNQSIEAERVHKAVEERNLKAAKEVLQPEDDTVKPCDFSTDQIKAFRIFRACQDSFTEFPNLSVLKQQEENFAKYELSQAEGAIASGELEQFSYGQRGGKTLAKLKNHDNEEIRRLANKLQMSVRKSFMKQHLNNAEEKIRRGIVKIYKDLNVEEAEAINSYQQYKYDEGVVGKYSGGIDRFEKELCSSELDEWEKWLQEGRLSEKVGPREHGKLRSLSKHKDASIKKRALAINDELKIADMSSTFQEMEAKRLYRLNDLNDKQKRALNTLRQFRHEVSNKDIRISPEILEMECERSRAELEKWETWNQNKQLKNKVQGYDRAVIRTLKDHPKPDISQRAKVLFDVLNPPRGQASGRGRGRGRGRRN